MHRADPAHEIISVCAQATIYLLGVIVSVIVILQKGFSALTLVTPLAIFATIVITAIDSTLGFWAGGPNFEN